MFKFTPAGQCYLEPISEKQRGDIIIYFKILTKYIV